MRTFQQAMPVGIDDFKQLIQGGYFFVDKSRFIQKLLDSPVAVTLITRPRRFGKTLALSMLRYFFTLENAEENQSLFHGLDIETAGEAYRKEHGTRPVVFLTLKEVQRPTFDSMLTLLSYTMQDVYGQHRQALSKKVLEEPQAEYAERILAGKSNAEDLLVSLKRLLMYLEKFYGRKPILLLDEYDAPILSAWEKGYYEECVDFMRGFLGSVLKSNPSLDFAVLTGVTRISKESIFSGLNNLKVCSVLSDSYSDIFGFTQEEVTRLMTKCGVGDKLPEIKQWYDGYQFGSTELYNPWSVIRYIDEGCVFRPYWLNVSGNNILHFLLEHIDGERQKELEELMNGNPVEATIDEGVIYADIQKNSNSLYMMMLTTGYLKAVEVYWDPSGEELPTCKLLIPNREIRLVYRREILGWMATTSDSIQLQHMLRAMVSGNGEAFQNRLRKILAGIVSFHDAARSPENFYHGMMLGFSVLMKGSYRVESNRESGYGRFDLAFFPSKEGAPGVILELKAAKSEEELEKKAQEALRQIEEKAYLTEFSRQGVKEVWKYGISFSGKRVWVEQG